MFLERHGKRKKKKTYEKTRQPNNNSDINHTYSNNSIFNTRNYNSACSSQDNTKQRILVEKLKLFTMAHGM